MSNSNIRKEGLIYCSVVTELQAAQVTKICQDYGIQSVIKLKPFVDISQLKRALKVKMKDRLYDQCPCGSRKKFKFCCYKDELNIEL